MRRYPGPDPFTQEYKDVFFGRETEKNALLAQIATNRLTIVFGRSGIGKSSLLNAAIIPELEQQYTIVLLRFLSDPGEKKQANADPVSTPKETFITQLSGKAGQSDFLAEIDYLGKGSMWYSVKNLQKRVWQQSKKESGPQTKGLIIIMDQFEEVFSYPENEYLSFGKGLSEVINNRIPEYVQRKLYQAIAKEPALSSKIKNDLNLIETEPELRIVIGIRSDRLSRLENFSSFIPSIYGNMLEVKQLTTDQAKEAIKGPAGSGNPLFECPVFNYEDKAIEKIINYLQSQKDKTDKTVEAFQLQMICQRIEEMILERKITDKKDGVLLVYEKKLPRFDEIVKNYYKNFLYLKDKDGKDVFNETERLFIRYLVEKKLVNEKNKTRLSIDQALIEPIGISDQLLKQLVQKRIIRVEPNTVKGYSYEICHDTMVESLIYSDVVLGNLNEKLLAYFKKYTEDTNEQKLKNKGKATFYQELLFEKLMTDEGEPKEVFIFKDSNTLTPLIERKILRTFTGENGGQKAELYEAFVRPALTVKSELEQTSKQTNRRRLKVYAVITVLAAIIIFGLLLFANKLMEERDRSKALLLVTQTEDVKDDKLALRLLEHALKLSGDTATIGPKISERYSAGIYTSGPAITSRELVFDKSSVNNWGFSDNSKYFFAQTEKEDTSNRLILDEFDDTEEQDNGRRDFFGRKEGNDEGLKEVSLYSLPAVQIAHFDKVLKAEFLGNSDTLAMIRKNGKWYTLELIDASDIQKKIPPVYLPGQNAFVSRKIPGFRDNPRTKNVWDVSYVHFAYTPGKIGFFYYAEMSKEDNESYPLYCYSQGKWTDLNTDRMTLVAYSVKGDASSFLFAGLDEKNRLLSYKITDLNGRSTIMHVPAGVWNAKFSEKGEKIFCTGDSLFFVTDIKSGQTLSFVRGKYINFGFVSEPYIVTLNAEAYSQHQFWKIEKDSVRLTGSFSGFTPAYLNKETINPFLVFFSGDMPWELRRKTNNINYLTIYDVRTNKSRNIAIDSSLKLNGISYVTVKSKMIAANFEKGGGVMCIMYDTSGNKTDQFICPHKGYEPFTTSPDERWMAQTITDNSLGVFDLNHKTSAFDIKKILKEINGPGSLVPALTAEQKKAYNIKPKSFWNFLF